MGCLMLACFLHLPYWFLPQAGSHHWQLCAHTALLAFGLAWGLVSSPERGPAVPCSQEDWVPWWGPVTSHRKLGTKGGVLGKLNSALWHFTIVCVCFDFSYSSKSGKHLLIRYWRSLQHSSHLYFLASKKSRVPWQCGSGVRCLGTWRQSGASRLRASVVPAGWWPSHVLTSLAGLQAFEGWP